MSITLTQLSCPNCGGPIQFVPGMPVANCPYCETKIALETQNAQGASVQVEPHQVRPFRVDQANFERGLLSWLADGDYTPDDILSGVMVSEHTGLYVPFFRFTGEYRATFTASAGYERQETYVAYRKDSNGNRVPVTKTRTVTDWRPASGEASREFTVWSTASQKLPEERMEWCEETVGSQDDQWEVLSEEVIKGYAMEPFDQTADEVYAKRGKSSLSGQVRQVCRNMVQGDKCKDLRTEFSIRERDESHHYAPFWIASLKYKGETFTYVRSGSGGHLSDGPSAPAA